NLVLIEQFNNRKEYLKKIDQLTLPILFASPNLLIELMDASRIFRIIISVALFSVGKLAHPKRPKHPTTIAKNANRTVVIAVLCSASY
ncbi:MAG: hypothetical protein ACTILG_10570, partial [Sphingobacterium sp.]